LPLWIGLEGVIEKTSRTIAGILAEL